MVWNAPIFPHFLFSCFIISFLFFLSNLCATTHTVSVRFVSIWNEWSLVTKYLAATAAATAAPFAHRKDEEKKKTKSFKTLNAVYAQCIVRSIELNCIFCLFCTTFFMGLLAFTSFPAFCYLLLVLLLLYGLFIVALLLFKLKEELEIHIRLYIRAGEPIFYTHLQPTRQSLSRRLTIPYRNVGTHGPIWLHRG